MEGASITDGYDDNGIDAIYLDKNYNNLWIVQSKFIENGTGAVETGDIEKFARGIKLLIDANFDRFNAKVRDKEDDVLEALDNPTMKIQIIFAYTGKEFSSHNKQSIADLLDELNDGQEICWFTEFNIDKAYKGLDANAGYAPINETISLMSWGHIEEPFKSYYGLISGTELADLWNKYGPRLFTQNIRNFLGNSSANEEISSTVQIEPNYFIYFNNGITILCDNIRKTPMGGPDKNFGTFVCDGISVVNGAQTLGTIGSLGESHKKELGDVKVLVKFISLQDSPSGFGQRITVATNTQNKVERKDLFL